MEKENQTDKNREEVLTEKNSSPEKNEGLFSDLNQVKKIKQSSQDNLAQENEPTKKSRNKSKIWAIFFLSLVAFFLIVIGLYLFSPLGRFLRPVLGEMPLPVAMVDDLNGLISSRRLILSTDAVKKFYQAQNFSSLGMRIDFSTSEGKFRLLIKEKGVLDKLIENEMLRIIAEKNGLKIAPAEAQKVLDEKIAALGDEQKLRLHLKTLYGWTLEDFRDNVVIYQLYLEKLLEKFDGTSVKERSGYKKITAAKSELKKDGSNFSQIVEKYSQGQSAKNGGALGWFRLEQLSEKIAEQISALEKGKISDIIIDELGFHIILVEDIRLIDVDSKTVSDEAAVESGNDKNESLQKTNIEEEKEVLKKNDTGAKVKEIKIKQIFISDQSFFEWLRAEKAKLKVKIFMDEYLWDENNLQVIFKSEKLRDLEKKVRLKSQGDPSLQ